ncbi:MAG TPA: hypothetical protein PKV44_01185 [Bacillota bacterium]|nr:hypothetical protein [Bacillota bacterium]HPE39111.1 hypothetical protein [Bacillota bacterium]
MALFDPKQRTILGLQKAIEDKTSAVNRLYDEIGKLYYQQYVDVTSDVAKDINERCENISTLLAEIEDCKLKILYERGLKVCTNCKKENPLEHAFCSACGMKFPNENEANASSEITKETKA